MYEYIPFIAGGAIFVMGVFMFLNPKQATKKEFRASEEQVKKIKKNGIIMSILGVCLVLIGLI